MITPFGKVWRVVCDSCGSMQSHRGQRTQMHLELLLRQSGWRTTDKEHICPACLRGADAKNMVRKPRAETANLPSPDSSDTNSDVGAAERFLQRYMENTTNRADRNVKRAAGKPTTKGDQAT